MAVAGRAGDRLTFRMSFSPERFLRVSYFVGVVPWSMSAWREVP